MGNPPGSVAPGSATTTRSPTAKFSAPHTMPRGAALTDVDRAPPHRLAVGVHLVLVRLDPAHQERTVDVMTGALDGLDLEAGGDQPLGERATVDVGRDVGMLAQP